MKINIQIVDYKDLKSEATGNTFTVFKTNSGEMSAFEDHIIEDLKMCKDQGKIATVEIVNTEKNGKAYANIRKFLGSAEKKEIDVEEMKIPPNLQKPIPRIPARYGTPEFKNNNRNTTMYVSYAKDIFCELIKGNDKNLPPGEVMIDAINLVKQAKEAFE